MLSELDKVIIETERKLLEVINNAKLPITILSMIMKNLLDEVDRVKFNGIKQYNKELNEKNINNKTNTNNETNINEEVNNNDN